MTFLKRLVRGMSAWTLSFSLFMLASFTILTLTILNAHYIKATLYKSNVYQNIVPAALGLAVAKSTDSSGNISSDNIDPQTIKQLEPVIAGAISPQFLQTTTEAIINGSFLWLNGKTPEPVFIIKTAGVKTALHNGLVNYIQNRLASLPVCPRGTSTNNFDPLSSACKPPVGISSAEIEQNVNKFIDQIPVFQKDDISLQSLGANDAFATDKPVQKVPMGYGIATKLPFAFAALVITSGTILVLAGADKRRSWRTIGHTFAWAGILLVVGSAATLFFANKFTTGLLGSASAEQAHFANTVVTPITKLFITTFADYSLYFGVGYCLIGTVCYVVSHRMRRNVIDDKQPTASSKANSKAPLTQGS